MKWNPLLKSQIYYQPRASMVQPKELQLHHGTEYTQGNKARQGKARKCKEFQTKIKPTDPPSNSKSL